MPTISGTAGPDTLAGGPGNDSITGGPGDDRLTGGTGAVHNYALATFAGSGRPTLGDGGPATAATLASPDRVLAVGGLVYIADTENNRVAVVDSAGVIRTFAGSVSAENQNLGDGGAATDAVVRFPHGLFATANGLYIGDHTYTVRFVNSGGTITHAALPDRAAAILPWAVAVDGAGRIYMADLSHNRVLRGEADGSFTVIAGTGVAGTTGDGGQATMAQINAPSDLRFDGQGHLLVGSSEGPLRQIDLSTGIISTRLQTRMHHFDLDRNGAFIVSRGNEVLRVDPTTGAETVIAGTGASGFSGDGGLAVNATFNNIQGVSVDAAGVIFVADLGNDRIREITPNGIVTTFAGGGPAVGSLTTVTDSQGIAFDPSGNLYMTDFQYHHIRKVLADGSTVVVAGSGVDGSTGDGGAAISAAMDHPSFLRFDSHGNLFFLDLNNSSGMVRMIRPGADGVITGAADETISTVAGDDIGREHADHGAADGGRATSAVFVAARDFLFDSHGDLIIADWLDNRIRKVTPGADGVFNGGSDETISTIAGDGGAGQTGDGGLATAAHVEAPNRLAIDAHDNLYLFSGVNTADPMIRKIALDTGVITTLVRGFNVSDMIVDHAGRLFYTDGASQVVQVDTTTGARTVVAGYGQTGFGGDGGDALQGLFRGASYLAVDASNSLYLVDNGNFRIRRLIDTGGGGTGDNTVSGGEGNDTITAADGTNRLRGDEGDDSISGGSGFDDINGNMGADTLHGNGASDWVLGGKDNDVVFGDDGDDIVNGNLGDDTCEGGLGADTIRGGQSDDILRGGAGDDWISGDRGTDQIFGGAGADRFHLFNGSEMDWVNDFNVAEGDRVVLDAGTTYTAYQFGADTVIDVAGGRMMLVGVTLANLPAGWILVG